uniref:LEM domain-containing protein n=1 Tax=Amphiprion ocellaris TaxID=80972 RepID=A0AAQ5Y2Z0_AMPOC
MIADCGITDKELRLRLVELGESPGPISRHTRPTYLRRLRHLLQESSYKSQDDQKQTDQPQTGNACALYLKFLITELASAMIWRHQIQLQLPAAGPKVFSLSLCFVLLCSPLHSVARSSRKVVTACSNICQM